MKYAEITEKIIDCAMKVHRELGFGFQEYIYQRALAIELKKINLRFVREYDMSIYYSGELIGVKRVDFFVEDKIMVELKALINLEDQHFAQAFNYIEASGIEIGLLINFGSNSFQFKRLHNRKLTKQFPNNP
jgi:GxxExxY protein